MTDRDWDRELAAIDRRIATTPDRPPTNPTAQPAAPPPARAQATAAPAAPARSIGTPAPSGRRGWKAQLALLFRLALGVAIVAAIVYWPYAARCGAMLGYYLALVGALGVVGLWTSVAAWRHRAAFVHLLGLAMTAAAFILGAREVLPKVGYAVPTVEHPATWGCTP